MKEYLINGKLYRLNIFEKITKQEEAYLIGYLCGDGSFQSSTHKRLARLYINSIDKYIIDFFRNYFCPDNNINERIPINTKYKNIKSSKLVYTLNFSSKFYKTFNKFGILDLKINRKFVNIPKKMFQYYLLGIFDADGSISWGKRKDRNRLWATFQITHQSINVLNAIQKYLYDELDISSVVSPRKFEKCLDLRISKIESVIKLYNYIYNAITTIHNSRKENHWKNFVLEYNKTYNVEL